MDPIIHRFSIALMIAGSLVFDLQAVEVARKPNIVVILADDAGYGDVSLYGSKTIKTPNLDSLAAQGLRFTEAYASAATCTPTRYGLMTGEYAWRMKGTGILPGDAELIIKPGRTTLPSVLHKAGYTTGIVGKWHLGLGDGKIDWNGDIKPGPLEVGFDYYFGMPATGDRVPTVYVENHRIVGLDPKDPITVDYRRKVGDRPTFREHPELATMKSKAGHAGTIVNGIGRIGFMAGGEAALWKDDTLSDTFRAKALGFIERNKDKPFFLYYAMHEPHAPHVPAARFVGKSGLGPRMDAMLQLDDAVGEVMATLDRLGIADNTLILFTSDNGPAQHHGYDDGSLEAETKAGHDGAGGLRGQKMSFYEGGVRMPFIAVWPGHIKPGISTDAVVCTVDFLATAAELVGYKLTPDDAPDSQSFLPVLAGKTSKGRDSVLLEGMNRTGPQAIRDGDWKLVVKPEKTATSACEVKVLGLYDLKSDEAEKVNVARKNPRIVSRLKAKLIQQWSAGATRSGAVVPSMTNS